MDTIDQVVLNFSEDSLTFLNITLGFIMFGVALDLKLPQFREVMEDWVNILGGVLSQIVFLPLITIALVWIISPIPSLALGMLLIAVCPGGNISNFMTNYGGGNTALSVVLTIVSTTLAIVHTPYSFSFLAEWYTSGSDQIPAIAVDPSSLMQTVLVIIGLPLVLGMCFSMVFAKLSKKIYPIMQKLSLLIFLGFIVIALKNNFDFFLNYVHYVVGIVFIHNLIAFATGYSTGVLFRRALPERISYTIETGIQNSGLALVLVFNFFPEYGGMAILAAWWGIWHIISGLLVATLFRQPSVIKLLS